MFHVPTKPYGQKSEELPMDHFTHQVLTEQREERLARKLARYEAIGYAGPGRPSLRRPAARLLRAIANRLAPQVEPEASTGEPVPHPSPRPVAGRI